MKKFKKGDVVLHRGVPYEIKRENKYYDNYYFLVGLPGSVPGWILTPTRKKPRFKELFSRDEYMVILNTKNKSLRIGCQVFSKKQAKKYLSIIQKALK